MITTEQFKQYTDLREAIEARAYAIAEILNSIDPKQYPLHQSRECIIWDDGITVRSNTGRSYAEDKDCYFDISILFQTDEQIREDAEAVVRERAIITEKNEQIIREQVELQERALLNRLKAKYENG